jgi:NADH pyrophosphatase NudC (nudix superfamily)
LREIKEEIGVTNIKQISDVISTFQWAKSDGFMITEYAYMVEVDPNCKIILSDEHIDYIWCGFDDAYKILGRDGNKRTLKLADKKLM